MVFTIFWKWQRHRCPKFNDSVQRLAVSESANLVFWCKNSNDMCGIGSFGYQNESILLL